MFSLHRNDIWAVACFGVAMFGLFLKGCFNTESHVTAAANGPVVVDIDD
jgi:hypothetical protein